MAFPEPVSYLTKRPNDNIDVAPIVPGDIAITFQTLRFNETIPAGYSAVVNDTYTINANCALTIGLGARFRIL